jgi:hypothetical protein
LLKSGRKMELEALINFAACDPSQMAAALAE